MDTPSHFFSDSVDLEAPGLFGTVSECDTKGASLAEDALMLFAPSTPGVDIVSTPVANKLHDSKPELWSSVLMDGDLFAESDSEAQGGLKVKIKTEEPDKIEDAITVAPPVRSTPSSRSGSSSKSTVSQRPSSVGSTATGLTTPPPPPPSQSQMNTKKRKSQTAFKEEEEDKDEMPGEAGQKRQKFLERNRVAATKCRQKKKQWIADLEEKSIVLENQKAYLESQHEALLEEIKSLKFLLMMHAKCNDPSIDIWLKTEAQRFVSEQGGHVVQYPPTTFPLSYAYSGQLDAASQSSPVSNSFAFPGHELEGRSPVDRRGSFAYSHTSTVQTTSPIDAGFPPIPSPQFKIEEGEEEVNLDHMPDSMFCSEQPLYLAA